MFVARWYADTHCAMEFVMGIDDLARKSDAEIVLHNLFLCLKSYNSWEKLSHYLYILLKFPVIFQYFG